MDNGDDILSVIFLVLICIVIAGIIHKVTPQGMYVPTFALIAVCLWVAFDYMLMQRYKAKAACLNKDQEIQEANEELNKLAEDLQAKDEEEQATESGDTDVGEKPVPDGSNKESVPVQQHKNEFDISMFNAGMSVDGTIQELHSQMGFGADTQIANRMKYLSLQSKLSKEIRARHNKYNLLPLFDEELRAAESSRWWDQEQDYLDAFM